MEELRVRVVALVREVRFRESLRRVYAESRHLATGDALTGLYTRGFALEHLKGLIAAADARSAVFSAAVGRIANIREINSLYGYAVGDRVIRQVGEVIGFVMRGEDLSARYDGACFLTLLPDTRAAAAERALKRVSGVVNHTEFTIPELDVPVPVVFAHASAEFSGHAGPEAFVTALSQRAHP
jgi:diguanylate cyclase (GGDEF)-like protein